MKFWCIFLFGILAGLVLSQVIERMRPSAQNVDNPAYLVVFGTVHDRPAFMQGYAGKLPPVYDQYGGTYLAVGGGDKIEVLEGNYEPASYVISRWKSVEAAHEFWNSPEYAPLKKARIDHNWGDFDVVLIEGLPNDR